MWLVVHSLKLTYTPKKAISRWFSFSKVGYVNPWTVLLFFSLLCKLMFRYSRGKGSCFKPCGFVHGRFPQQALLGDVGSCAQWGQPSWSWFWGKKVIQMSLHVTLMLADCLNLRRMYHVKSTQCPFLLQETVPFLKNFSISSLISATNIWSDRSLRFYRHGLNYSTQLVKSRLIELLFANNIIRTVCLDHWSVGKEQQFPEFQKKTN